MCQKPSAPEDRFVLPMRTSGLESLRKARDELTELSEAFYMPNVSPEVFVRGSLPLGNKSTSLEAQAECYVFVYHGDHIDAATNVYSELDDDFSTEVEVERQVLRFWNDTEKQRKEFREMLDSVLNGDDLPKVGKYIKLALDEIVLVPRSAWDGSTLKLEIRYCPLGIKGVMGYALMLLLDGSVDPSKFLKKCRLESCGDIFWGRTGGRPREYCMPRHKRRADALTGPERTAKSRRKKESE